TLPRRTTSASRPPPGTGTSSMWSGWRRSSSSTCSDPLRWSVQPGGAPLQLPGPAPPGDQQHDHHGETDAQTQGAEQLATGARITQKEGAPAQTEHNRDQE